MNIPGLLGSLVACKIVLMGTAAECVRYRNGLNFVNGARKQRFTPRFQDKSEGADSNLGEGGNFRSQTEEIQDALRDSIENREGSVAVEGISDDLSKLIQKSSEIIQRGDSEDLSKYDWFDDSATDTSDDELLNEYYENKIPSKEAIYKYLDPLGLNKIAAKNRDDSDKGCSGGEDEPETSRADNLLGRVYEVGKPLIDENKLKNRNTYKAVNNKLVNVNELSEWEPGRDEDAPDAGDPEKYIEYCNYNGTADVHLGREFEEDSEDIAMEDEMCRYFASIPLNKWLAVENEAFENNHKKSKRIEKYGNTDREEGNMNDPNVTDFREIYLSGPDSTTGIFDSKRPVKCGLSEDFLNTLTQNSSHTKELYAKEYKHNDLLIDIDKYEEIHYGRGDTPGPKENAGDKPPVFVLKGDDEEIQGAEEPVDANLDVYVSVPKRFIRFKERNNCFVDDRVVFRRQETYVGERIERIPIKDNHYPAIVLLPNEHGYRDQNIRYLGEELAVISDSLLFIPDTPNAPETHEDTQIYYRRLNRLFKYIQCVHKVNRVCIVALGRSESLIKYLLNAFKNTMKEHGPSTCNGPTGSIESHMNIEAEYEDCSFNCSRFEAIVNRQQVPVLEDLLHGLDNIKMAQKYKISWNLNDVNIIKPLASMLQTLILYDTAGVDLYNLVRLSVPTLVVSTQNNKIIENVLDVSKNQEAQEVGSEFNLPNDIRKGRVKGLKLIDALKGVQNAGNELLRELRDRYRMKFYHFKTRHSDASRTQYYLNTYYKGIDILLRMYNDVNRRGFYIKKPDSTKLEFNALKDSIASCANWIRYWTY